MAELVDLAYSKEELAEEKKECAISSCGQPDPYPWGLCMSLEKRELDKLGVAKLPQVGSEFHMMVIAKVTSVNQSASMTQEEESRVGLQVTMAQVLEVGSPEEEASEQRRGVETPAYEAAEMRKSGKVRTVMGD